MLSVSLNKHVLPSFGKLVSSGTNSIILKSNLAKILRTVLSSVVYIDCSTSRNEYEKRGEEGGGGGKYDEIMTTLKEEMMICPKFIMSLPCITRLHLMPQNNE